MKPIKDKMLAVLVHEEYTSPSGIIIGARKTHVKHKAKVLLVGPEVKETKVGDVIEYDFHHVDKGWYIDHDGKKCVFLQENRHAIINVSRQPGDSC